MPSLHPLRRGAGLFLAVLALAGWAAAARAELRFARPSVDLGEVRCGVPLSHRFAFVNEGPGAVEITEARAGCGCLAPRLARRTYAAGEGGELEVEVNTLSQAAGPHTWPVSLRYRSGDVPYELPLEIRARVVADVTVRPASLTVFADAALVQEVTLTDLRRRPLAVTAVRTTSPHLSARAAEPCQDALGNRVVKVRLEVAEDFPDGRHDEALDLYTDDPAYRDLRVPVTVVKRPRQRLSATPAEVSLTAAPGQPVPGKIVLVRSREDKAVEVETVAADDPAVSCRWARGPDQMATVKITVDPARIPTGSLRSAVHIKVRAPAPETLTVPVTFTFRP
jgi:hypothetical protein